MKKFIENKIIYYLIVAIVSLYVLIVFVKQPGINGYEPAMFPEMIYGTAWKPFVYRTLVPTTVRLLNSIIPEQVQNYISEQVGNNSFLSSVLQKLKWESEYITEYIIAFVIMYLFLSGFVMVFRKLFTVVYDSPVWFANLISIFLLLTLPTMFRYYSYIYDFPTLFLFTSGLLFLKQKNRKYFLILFFISCFNKETTILLTLIFAIHFYKDQDISKKFYYQFIAGQLLIFLVVKILLYFIFLNNPGGFVEFHLIDRNYLLFNGYSLATFVILVIIFLALFSRWDEKPEFLKDAMWISVPLIILTLFLGFFDELRDYYEVLPIVILLISFNIAKILGVNLSEHSAITQ